MSDRDCPDEMAVLWAEREERLRRNHLLDHPDCRDPAHPGCSLCAPTCRQCGAASYSDAVTMCIRMSHGDCHGSELWPDEDECNEARDKYGNPTDGSRLINCCFPDCGCDGSRLCQAENGTSFGATCLNYERGTWK